MKKSTKISLWVSLALVLIGGIVITCSLMSVGFDMRKMSDIEFHKKVYPITDSFDKIMITDVNNDITVCLSDNDTCKIVCYDSEKIYHQCQVNNDGELQVWYHDERPWYERMGFFYNDNHTLQVYLPKSEYQNLYAHTTNGEITVTDDFDFSNADLKTVNGNVHFDANVLVNLYAHTTNGDIALGGKAIHHLDVSSVNGDIAMNDITASHILAHTTNGDITGTVNADKTFQASTVNGSVSVPNEVKENGDFVLSTVNGNIDMKSR